MEDFTKIVFPGKHSEANRDMKIFIKIEYRNGTLSISGVEGPKRNGNCSGSCGQIEMHMDGDYLNKFRPTIGWNKEKFQKLIEIWRRWHCNDLRAGCVHQREAKWEDIRIDIDDVSTGHRLAPMPAPTPKAS